MNYNSCPSAAYFQHTRASNSNDPSPIDTFTNGLYEIALAFVVKRRLSIAPMMRDVFAIRPTGRAAYGVSVSYGFGR